MIYLLTNAEVQALRVRFRWVARQRGVTEGRLWTLARKEFGFRGYNILSSDFARLFAWVDVQRPEPTEPKQRTRLQRLLGESLV